ncbi:uncharacterized protein CTRU02_203587 [Colletotrichum truncatum]|uniref:Uncharacterized protein n=1 Tax=Colletotrichum truncatum TaxID=5467 RepID=A0ACC3Z9S9_COLTU|nr:uncharacterized protein CTRU02_03921 [Colletotrichum truncatum]KAF6795961.1 hypothetical protein CTRU02_03921 [Colletotrichum truncatum]
MSGHYEREARNNCVNGTRPQRGDPGSRPPSHSHYTSDDGGGGGLRAYSRNSISTNRPYISEAIHRSATTAVQYDESDLPLAVRGANALRLSAPLCNRPRSIPQHGFVVTRSRSRSRSRSPLGKTRHAIDHTFTPSSSGIGVGLLGAVVGGLAAREVSDVAVRSRTRKEMSNGTYQTISLRDSEKRRVISTAVGALVGGLGANVLERRLEAVREQDKTQQEAWERRWGKESDLPHYDTGKYHERNHGRGNSRGSRFEDGDVNYQHNALDNRRCLGRLKREE